MAVQWVVDQDFEQPMLPWAATTLTSCSSESIKVILLWITITSVVTNTSTIFEILTFTTSCPTWISILVSSPSVVWASTPPITCTTRSSNSVFAVAGFFSLRLDTCPFEWRTATGTSSVFTFKSKGFSLSLSIAQFYAVNRAQVLHQNIETKVKNK